MLFVMLGLWGAAAIFAPASQPVWAGEDSAKKISAEKEGAQNDPCMKVLNDCRNYCQTAIQVKKQHLSGPELERCYAGCQSSEGPYGKCMGCQDQYKACQEKQSSDGVDVCGYYKDVCVEAAEFPTVT